MGRLIDLKAGEDMINQSKVMTYSNYTEKGVRAIKLPLIDGTYRNIAVKSIAGRCHNNIHRGYLDIDLLQRHDCINKKCHFLERFDDYPFWVEYNKNARVKEIKKRIRKSERLKEEKSKALSDLRMNELLESAQKIANRLKYPVIITRVAPQRTSEAKYEYIINYVSDLLANDWHDYFDLVVTMAKCHGGKYYLRHMRFPNGDYVSISDWVSMNK